MVTQLFREEVINVELARLINSFGLKADPETIHYKAYPDVIISSNGVKINIEGRFVSNPDSKNLEKDVINRIENGIANIGLAIFYPDSIRATKEFKELPLNLKKSLYDISIIYFSDRGLKKYHLNKINVEVLVENLNNIYNLILNTDVLSEKIREVDDNINLCTKISSEDNFFFSSEKFLWELRKILNIEKKEKLTDIEKLQILKISLFILFNSLVFHEALSTHMHGINSLKKMREQEDHQSFISAEWEKILKIDFVPIFSISKKILLSLPSSIITEEILDNLSKQAISILKSGILLKHDLMGRIYHKLLLKVSGDLYATYYTSIPAAWILANLAIKTNFLKFSSIKEFENLSIIDPACGSGTLLSAVYNTIKDIYIINSSNRELEKLHKTLLEKIIYGWDVLDYAGHLTLTTLALHYYKTFFDKPNIYILPVGQINNNLHIGSLDYLEDSQQFLGRGFFTAPKRKGIKEEIIEDSNLKFGNFDLVIMNPPFSRSAGLINTKFGYENSEIQEKLNKHLSKLGSKLGLSGIGQAGLGAYFIILGDKLLNSDGIISIVIPRAILSGVSWQKIRDILLEKYEIQYIVNNHDSGCVDENIEPWNFSENTKLSEVLIVAKKSEESIENRYTTIINLWNKPKNEIESLIVSTNALKIRKSKQYFLDKDNCDFSIEYSKKPKGSIYNISQNLLNYNFLFPALFANYDLNKLTYKLLFKNFINLCNLDEISDSFGVDRKQISTSFKKVKVQTPYQVLWGYPITLNSILIKENNLDFVENLNEKSLDILDNASNLLLAEHIFLNNNSIVALYCKKPILSTAFWEVKFEDEISKVLTLWFNSTIGFILFISNSISSYGQQINIKKEQLKNIKVIDYRKLSKNTINRCLELFNEIKEEKFGKFPEEFLKAYEGEGIRKKIDDFFIETLTLNINLKEYYKILSSEPIISGKRL